MTKPGRDGSDKPGRKTSKQRATSAKEVAGARLAAERRRRRTALISWIAGGVIVLAGLIGYGVYAAQTHTDYNVPKHAVDDNSGVVAGGSGPIKVNVYIDYQCPICKAFEQSAGNALSNMVNKNQITLVYHPIAILDRASSTQYSTRAAGSSGCASDFDHFLPYTTALFAAQPPEGSTGLSDDQLIQIGGSVGINDPKFAQCVRDGTYKSWATHNTDVASQRGVTGTPTVFVNGKSIAAPGQAPTLANLLAATGLDGK
jgi:protein-disulfide isomerase